MASDVPPDLHGPTLDLLPAHVAVLDRHGVIRLTNQAWDRYAGANGPKQAGTRFRPASSSDEREGPFRLARGFGDTHLPEIARPHRARAAERYLRSRQNRGSHGVPQIDQATVHNRLLAALPPEGFAELAPLLETVELVLKQVLHAPGEPIAHAHFPESSVVSMITALEDGQALEVGLVGREGLVGLPTLLGDGTAANQALVQAPGSAWRVEAAALKAAFEASTGVRAVLLRYTLAFHDQVAQTAACNGRHGLEARLARWLLMAHDRAEGDAFPMTHEFLALMLGVRRAGVTVALGGLREGGAIAHERGVITVLDRPSLESVACGCHRAVQRQFERLLGPTVG